MNNKVIYTVLVGNYDSINQPCVINPDFDYFLFSNDIPEESVGVWRIKKIPYDNEDKKRIASWVKTHPEQLLPDYDASVCIDANIQITGTEFYDRIEELVQKKVLISSMWHNERDCIYDEAAAVAIYALDNEKTIITWLHKIVKEGYPAHNGLYELNVLYRIHNNSVIKNFDSLWWECINNYSRREQLSYCYVLWKLRIECPYFLSDSKNTRNSDCVKLLYHGKSENRRINRLKSENPFIIYYPNNNIGHIRYIYKKVAHLQYPYTVLFCMGQYYRLCNKVKLYLNRILNRNLLKNRILR